MFHHPLEGGLADHDETRSGGLYFGKTAYDLNGGRIVEFHHVIQGRGMEVRLAGLSQFDELAPIDIFYGVSAGGEIRLIFQEPKNLGGVKTDVRVNEQEMGGILVFHEMG